MATEPPPSRWAMPSVDGADEHGLVAAGADLEPGTLLAAYRAGLFPMPLTGVSRPPADGEDGQPPAGTVGWWSPDPRGVLPLADLVVSRSLRRSTRRYRCSLNVAFDQVVTACAAPTRPGGWIDAEVAAAYRRLHELGWAHSIEAWSSSGELVGGLYGVRVGALFAGESMFHRATDASKVALVHLVSLLALDGAWLLDLQWATPHLRQLGARSIPRLQYLDLLTDALSGRPAPGRWPDDTGDDDRA